MLFFLAMVLNEPQRSKLEEVYHRHGPSMYRVALRILNDEHLAQDALHEAFIRISENLEKINEVNCNRTGAYVVIIIRNISIDIYRRRKNQSGLPLEEIEKFPESGQSLEELVIDNTMFDAMVTKIKELPAHYADIIALKYFYHYDYEEIALILKISVENARTRMYRSKQSLIRLISQEQEVANND